MAAAEAAGTDGNTTGQMIHLAGPGSEHCVHTTELLMDMMNEQTRCHAELAKCNDVRGMHTTVLADISELVLKNNVAWTAMNTAFAAGDRAAATPHLADYQSSHMELMEAWDRAD